MSNILLWLKRRAKLDKDEYLRKFLLIELIANWQENPDTLPWLKKRASLDDSSWLRAIIIDERSLKNARSIKA